MLRFRRRILLTFVLLIVITSAVLLRSTTLPPPIMPEPFSTDYRALWDVRGSTHYRIIVETIAPPVPPLGWELTVRDGEIIDRSIIACDNPSEEYPERLCEPIQTYYQGSGLYTLEELFEIADACTLETQVLLNQCPAYSSSEFRGFSTTDELFDAEDVCEDYLQSWDSLCAVEYDPTYGYPRDTTILVYGVLDAGTTIRVKEVEIIEDE